MSRLSHLLCAFCLVLPALGVAAQTPPASPPVATPAPEPTKPPVPAKPAPAKPAPAKPVPAKPVPAKPAPAPAPEAPPSAASPARAAEPTPVASPVPPAVAAPAPVPAPVPTPAVAAPTSTPEAAPAAVAPATPTPPVVGPSGQPDAYGAGGPAPGYPYQPSLPEWAEAECPDGRCGPDCRERCRRHEYCSEYDTCEPIPELEGEEHKGLMLRVTSGYGFGSLTASKADVREGSLAVGLGVDVGSAVIENLIVRARLRGSVSYYRDSDFGENVLFSFGTAGVGVDYYFTPINIYVGGTVSVAGITRADEDRANRSKAGLGLDLDVGKEWWISRRWGIGIALRATYIDVAPGNILRAAGIGPSDARLRSLHVGLQFSATFN